MKIALLLSISCAALVLSGCSSTSSGGSEDTYNTSSGTVQTHSSSNDPSLPQDPNMGPQMVPP